MLARATIRTVWLLKPVGGRTTGGTAGAEVAAVPAFCCAAVCTGAGPRPGPRGCCCEAAQVATQCASPAGVARCAAAKSAKHIRAAVNAAARQNEWIAGKVILRSIPEKSILII